MTTVLRLNDVSKQFVIRRDKSFKERVLNPRRGGEHREEFWALDGVDLEFDSGTSVGLVGPNGSGKSTLLKMMGGVLQPTRGTVERRGRLAALIEIGAGFHPDLTGRENVFLNCSILGLSQQQTRRWFDDIVAFSGIERFIDTQVKFYSSGMYVRLAFAVAVHVDPDILLVDEVLAVGDEPFQRKCLDRIKRFQSEGRAIILVSHALEQVGELCERAVVLEHGKVVADGEPRDALRTLRADYESARLEEIEARTDRSGASAQAAVIEAVRVISGGEEVDRIDSGESVSVEIDVSSNTGLSDWILGMGLETPLGMTVYGTNTELLGVSLPDLAPSSSQTFRFEVPDLRLGPGEYFVQGALAAASGEELHRLPQGTLLTVEGDDSSVGVIGLRARLIG